MSKDEAQALKWLKRAESSYNKAAHGAEFSDIMYEDLCYDAQQAAEKALNIRYFYT
jgi:HEPN domain-containing protein